MPPTIADLRSDTVTRPTPAMLDAIHAAELGDDVLGDDPTVNALERRVSDLFEKEAALFTPSGTMANQLAIRCHTQPGDMMLCHDAGHVYEHESGAPAALSGVTPRLIDAPRGVFTPNDLERAMWPADLHFASARLVVMENTNNAGGGSLWSVEQMAAVAGWATERGLAVHLDGARLWNAHVASGSPLAAFAQHADTVSACLSKGLGAPVGSVLIGDTATIARARRFRKMFGGAMRQAGLLAAGALHALDHHIDRLADDHRRARRLAEGLAGVPGVLIDPAEVETNIVYFALDAGAASATRVCERCERAGVRMLELSAGTIRAVTHLDVDDAGIDAAIDAVRAAVDLG